MPRIAAALVVLVPVVAALTGLAAQVPADEVALQILAINDFHGALEASAGNNGRLGDQLAGGVEFLAAHMARLRAGNPNTLIVSGGDNVGGTPLLSSLSHHEASIEALNAVGLQLSVVGNHELDDGWWELLRLARGGCHPVDGCQDGTPYGGARFRYLAANLQLDPSAADPRRLAEAGIAGREPRPLVPGFAIETIGGVNVGVIGTLPQAARTTVAPDRVRGLTFTPEVEAANAAARELRRQGASVVVLLTHEGGFTGRGDVNGCKQLTPRFAADVARYSDDIDVVASGHTHWAYVCTVDGTLVTSASSSGRVITDIDLTVSRSTGRVVRKTARNVVVTRDLPPDPMQVALLSHYRPVAERVGGRVVGTVARTIGRIPNAAGEIPLGGPVADAMLDAAVTAAGRDVAFAFTNPWGLRADLVKGPGPRGGEVTYAELFEVLPFGNVVEVRTLTGAVILEMLEDQFDGPQPRVMQVSRGFTYAYDLTRAGRTKVDRASVRVGGAALEPTRRYRVASLDFLWNTGDGMRALAGATETVTVGPAVDVVAEYLAAHSPLEPGRMDRIRRLDAVRPPTSRP